MDSKCDILILSASFGYGHNSVAKAVKEQINHINKGYIVEVMDILDVFHPTVKKVSKSIYNILTKRFPKIYNYFYNIKKDYKNNIIDSVLYFSYYNEVRTMVENKKPDIIISTFPLCSGFISKIKERDNVNIPLITIVTDVVDSWEWIHNGTDLYFLPSKEIREKYIAKGVERSKVRVTGIPVKEEFYTKDTRNKKKTKQILIMDSAMGKVGIDNKLLDSLGQLKDVKTVIVTGSNKKLYHELKGKNKYSNIEILGYTNEIAKLMDASDLLITKPGGVTLFESINKCIPSIFTKSDVGQECGNIDFIVNSGIGVMVDYNENCEELLKMIKNILNDKKKCEEIISNMKSIREDMESQKIGQYSLELLYR